MRKKWEGIVLAIKQCVIAKTILSHQTVSLDTDRKGKMEALVVGPCQLANGQWGQIFGQSGQPIWIQMTYIWVQYPYLYPISIRIAYSCTKVAIIWPMSAEGPSQKFVRIPNEMPQASNQNCNTMAPNICWPKIVRTKLDKAYLNQN